MNKKIIENLAIPHLIDLNIVQALGTNALIFKELTNLYNKNSSLYEKTYRMSPLFNHGFFDMHPVHFKSYLKQAAGIYYYCQTYPLQNDLLFQLMKKGYSEIYRYVLENEVVRPLRLMQLLNKKRNRGINNYDRPLQYAYTITIYLANHFKKPIENEEFVLHMISELTKQQYFDYNIQGEIEVNYNDISKSLRENFFRGYKEMNIIHLINAMIEDEIVRTLKKIKNPSLEQYELTKDRLYDEGFETAIIGFYTGILKSNGFFEQKLNRILTKEESITYLKMMDMFLSNMTHLSKDVLETLKISSLFMLGIIKEHEDLEVLYDDQLNNTKVNQYIKEIERLKVEMEQQRVAHAAKFFKKENEIVTTKHALTLAQEENDTLKKEIERLNKQLQDTKQNELELQALRKYAFLSNEIVEHEEAIDLFEQNVQFLQKKKIVLAGGHINWVTKMKKLFPNFIYLSPEDQNRSFDFLKNEEYIVFVNTATNSHALYERIIAHLKTKKQLSYINLNYNIETSVQLMFDFIEKTND